MLAVYSAGRSGIHERSTARVLQVGVLAFNVETQGYGRSGDTESG